MSVPFATVNMLNSIKSTTKTELLSCLSSMQIVDLKDLIFTSIQNNNPKYKQLIQMIWFDHQNNNHSKRDNYCTKIGKYFANKDTKNDPMQANNAFASLPTNIGAYIISFSNMNDRINCHLISKDLYKFCQIPAAKYHLIIDHKFVKALYLQKINYHN
eukprot:309917_1